jgi:hypothetical protein
MDVTDLLLTAIPITLGVTLILCCYFHKCAPSRYVFIGSLHAGIVKAFWVMNISEGLIVYSGTPHEFTEKK